MSIYYANDTIRSQKLKAGFTGHDGNAALFTQGQLEQLTAAMNFRKFEAGAYLFWEGDPADSVYYIKKGHVKLRRSTDDGRDLLLSILQPNDLLVDIDAWDTTHRFSAQVMDNAEVGVISRLQLELLMSKSGEFAFRFAMWLSLMNRITESKLRDLLMLGKQGALASTLVRLTNSFGILQEDGILITMKLTNTELAELVGTTRESVNRMLSAMKDDGIVETAPGGLMRILKLHELEKIAGCPDCPGCPKELCRI